MSTNAVLFSFFASLTIVFTSKSEDSATNLLRISLSKTRKLPENAAYHNVTVELHNNHNWCYSGYVSIGNPPQKLRLEFDTGSADLWVASTAICKTNPSYCVTHNTYNHNESSTYKHVGDQIKLPYGTEGIHITTAIENFEIGGLKIKGQHFGEATSIENVINDEKYSDEKDGIFGLSFPKSSYLWMLAHKPTPLMNMVSQGLLRHPIFAIYLAKAQSPLGGELVLGGMNPARYTGEFVFSKLVSEKRWAVHVERAYFGSTVVAQNFTAVVDSGTTLIHGPEKFILPIRENIFGSNGKKTAVPCDIRNKMPNVTFVIEGKEFVLTPEDYIFKEYSKVNCVFGFFPVPGLNAVVLGNVFMRKYYMLFDMGRRRIGFAPAKTEE